MKICDIVQFYSPLSGGVKRYIHEKMHHFSGESHLDHVIIIPSHRNAMRTRHQVRIYEVKSPPLIGSRVYRVLLAKNQILHIIHAEEPDLIEVADPYRSAWIAVEAARQRQIPIVAFYHSDYPRALCRTLRKYAGAPVELLFSRAIERYLVMLYNRMDATVVPAVQFKGTLAGIGIRRLVHIPLGVDASVFRLRQTRSKILRELKLGPEVMLLLYVGRLAREKNIHQLFAMMDHLSSAEGQYHLVLVGDGDLREYVRLQTSKRPDATWLSYCRSQERLAELYSAADLFVHGGTGETFGLVSLEAQACGTRVLAVQGGGLEQTLEGEQPLIMAADANGRSLAAAVSFIRKLKEGEEHRIQRRQRVLAHFSWRKTFRELLSLYAFLCLNGSWRTYLDSEGVQTTDHDSILLTR
jgi:alpha-1,6-mannosyltransferase